MISPKELVIKPLPSKKTSQSIPIKKKLLIESDRYFIEKNNTLIYLSSSSLLSNLNCTGKEGMGEGDFKLFSAFGAWFGWQALPLILVVSSFAGAVIGIVILKSSKQDNDTPLAFGPYLCIAAYLYMLYGQTFMQWYLSRFLS